MRYNMNEISNFRYVWTMWILPLIDDLYKQIDKILENSVNLIFVIQNQYMIKQKNIINEKEKKLKQLSKENTIKEIQKIYIA